MTRMILGTHFESAADSNKIFIARGGLPYLRIRSHIVVARPYRLKCSRDSVGMPLTQCMTLKRYIQIHNKYQYKGFMNQKACDASYLHPKYSLLQVMSPNLQVSPFLTDSH